MPGPVIGVDVGGTKIASARLRGGTLEDQHVEPTDRSSTEALLDEICRAAEAIKTDEVVAVGVGVPAAVEFESGRAKSGVNVPLTGVPVRSTLTERLGVPVYVDNDANCAAIAEAHDDDGDLMTRDLVMYTLGTGVGGGIVIGGRPYRGATGAAAEMGHQLVAVDLERGAPDARDRFPQPGSLESLASGTALNGITQRFAEERPESALGRRLAEQGEVTGVDAVDLAMDGDADARAAVRLLGERIGVGVANALNIFDPEVVAIGGGVSRAGDLLLEPAIEVGRRFALPGCGERTEIRLSKWGPEAGLRGAALMAALEFRHET